MNDITPKEAIANLNHIYGFVAPDIQRSLDVAIKALERPQDKHDRQEGEWVRGFIDALDKASLMFDTDRTYSGERVLQMLAKLKWLEKLKEEKGSAE